MKRLLKISFDASLLSLIPILSWFALSLIIDRNLINVFTLMYPIQFIWCILKCIFSTGANIAKQKDKNNNAVMSGLVLGTVVGGIIFGFLALNIEKYITFMNMDIATYKSFAIYYVIQLYIQLIFAFVLNKLYYEEKNNLANKYSITFNTLNFIVLIGSALVVKNTTVVILLTLITLFIYTLVITIKCSDKFKLQFNISKFIQYDSVDLFNNLAFFFIFLFGLSNALEFGEKYALAITFISLITDTQWDVFDAISTVAKIDISKNKFNIKEHVKNAYKLGLILIASILIMFITLFSFYNLDIPITLIFLSIEIFNFIVYPLYRIKTCFLQLEYSATKTTTNKIMASMLRLVISFLSTPYCTTLGQVASSIYQTLSINVMFNKHYDIDKVGNIIKLSGGKDE